MNQAFIAIVVKILAPIFTIPTRFMDLLWPATERTNDRSYFHVAFEFIEYECQSKSMQRIPLLSLALLSTVAASSEALAGPLSINPVPQRSAAPPIASIYGAPPPAEPLPIR